PSFRASIVAAEMTEFIPGAGPPPHKIPSFTRSSFQQRCDPRKRSCRAGGSQPRTFGIRKEGEACGKLVAAPSKD
ncbi:MAG TPA: hypothetical protein VKG80_14395, partial [Trebonia sp.]|nr:hypothetical protein [Trebonia sp.]